MNDWDNMFDEDTKEENKMDDNRTNAKKFFDENKEEIICCAVGVLAGLYLVNRSTKKRSNLKKRQDTANREMLIWNTGYLEGQKDAYRDVAKNRHSNHHQNHKK